MGKTDIKPNNIINECYLNVNHLYDSLNCDGATVAAIVTMNAILSMHGKMPLFICNTCGLVLVYARVWYVLINCVYKQHNCGKPHVSFTHKY